MVASGNEIEELSPLVTAQIVSLGDGVTADWIAGMDAKGFDGAALVEDARAAVAAHR